MMSYDENIIKEYVKSKIINSISNVNTIIPFTDVRFEEIKDYLGINIKNAINRLLYSESKLLDYFEIDIHKGYCYKCMPIVKIKYKYLDFYNDHHIEEDIVEARLLTPNECMKKLTEDIHEELYVNVFL